MNNSFFGISQDTQGADQPASTFDIFGSTTNEAPVAPAPTVAMPQTPIAPSPVDNGILGGAPAMPEAPTPTFGMPEAPAAPVDNGILGGTPAMPEAPTPTFGMPEAPAAPVDNGILGGTPAMPEATAPTFGMPAAPAPVDNGILGGAPAMPKAQTPTFDIPAAPISTTPEVSNSSESNMFAVPESPAMQQVEVPQTAPIIETPTEVTQQSANLFSFGEPTQAPAEQTIPETKVPEPIIVTDYSKQYDPVMPEAPKPISKAEFKEVIAAIRECSKKIEQFGYMLDVEEYNLENIYQVVFKINKD